MLCERAQGNGSAERMTISKPEAGSAQETVVAPGLCDGSKPTSFLVSETLHSPQVCGNCQPGSTFRERVSVGRSQVEAVIAGDSPRQRFHAGEMEVEMHGQGSG